MSQLPDLDAQFSDAKRDAINHEIDEQMALRIASGEWESFEDDGKVFYRLTDLGRARRAERGKST
jgi:hypothetical protein